MAIHERIGHGRADAAERWVRAQCVRCHAHANVELVQGELVGRCGTCGCSRFQVIPQAPLLGRFKRDRNGVQRLA